MIIAARYILLSSIILTTNSGATFAGRSCVPEAKSYSEAPNTDSLDGLADCFEVSVIVEPTFCINEAILYVDESSENMGLTLKNCISGQQESLNIQPSDATQDLYRQIDEFNGTIAEADKLYYDAGEEAAEAAAGEAFDEKMGAQTEAATGEFEDEIIEKNEPHS